MTETIYTLSLHACAEGDILPLAFLPATAAPAPFAVHAEGFSVLIIFVLELFM